MKVRRWCVLLALTACTSTTGRTQPAPTPSLADRVAGWEADIEALLSARDTVHPDGWHGQTRQSWLTAAAQVRSKLPQLTENQALVELVRLAAMPSYAGRDGHSGIFPFTGPAHAYPLRWWQFPEGLVITAARAPYGDLVGRRVEAVEGRPVAEVLKLVEPLAPRDNASNLLAYSPLYLRSPELLDGLGVTHGTGPARFTLVGPDGARSDAAVTPVPASVDAVWTAGQPQLLPQRPADWLRRQSEALWWSYLARSRTLYVQLNKVQSGTDGLVAEILARARRPDVARVVLDLRHNGGGDNSTLGPLETALSDPAVDRPGRLHVLIGRCTFSAAANLATDLDLRTAATFAGEALGGSPNLYGDATEIPLPWGGQSLYMATRYWQRSSAGDRRVTIEPELAVPLTAAAYFAGRDPVLEAALR
jgi:hypothetical protein